MLHLYRLIQEIHYQQALRHSYLHPEITNEHLTKSRVEAAIQISTTSKEAETATEIALRRSRIEAEMQAAQTVTEAALYRSRKKDFPQSILNKIYVSCQKVIAWVDGHYE